MAASSGLRRQGVRLIADLVTEDAGQDLVEYTLLLMFFGIAALAAWTSIAAALGTSFGQTSAGVQGLWDPPAPGGSGP